MSNTIVEIIDENTIFEIIDENTIVEIIDEYIDIIEVGIQGPPGIPIRQKYKHTEVIGDGINTEYVITHNLNTRACTISVWRTNSPYDEIDYYVEKTSPDTITLFFNRILEPGEFTAVIIG